MNKSRSIRIVMMSAVYAAVILASMVLPQTRDPNPLLWLCGIAPFVIGLVGRTAWSFSLPEVIQTLTPLALLIAYLVATTGMAILPYAIPFAILAILAVSLGHYFAGLVNRTPHRKE